MIEVKPHTIQLIVGYTDNTKGRKTHKSVTFGKLLTGRMLFAIDEDPQSNLPTQYEAMLIRACITEFGTLRMPTPLTALLALDSIERDDLTEAFNQFSEMNRGGKEPEQIDGTTLRLAVGYERNGLTYDVVTFGKRITGMDDVEADRLDLKGIRRICFLAGKQVVSLSQSDGKSTLEGQLGLEIFEELLASDIQAIRVASEVYRQSFRLSGAGVSPIGRGAERVDSGDGDRMAGRANSENAD